MLDNVGVAESLRNSALPTSTVRGNNHFSQVPAQLMSSFDNAKRKSTPMLGGNTKDPFDMARSARQQPSILIDSPKSKNFVEQ